MCEKDISDLLPDPLDITVSLHNHGWSVLQSFYRVVKKILWGEMNGMFTSRTRLVPSVEIYV